MPPFNLSLKSIFVVGLIILITGTVLLFALTLESSTRSNILTAAEAGILTAAEAGFLFGQREALKGDVRVKYNESLSCWEWIESPWDGGRQPIYDDCKGKI